MRSSIQSRASWTAQAPNTRPLRSGATESEVTFGTLMNCSRRSRGAASTFGERSIKTATQFGFSFSRSGRPCSGQVLCRAGAFPVLGPNVLERLAKNPPDRLHFVLGYSGWGAAQLETELAEGAWLNSDVTAEFIFSTPAENMWEEALRRIGVPPETLAPASGVH